MRAKWREKRLENGGSVIPPCDFQWLSCKSPVFIGVLGDFPSRSACRRACPCAHASTNRSRTFAGVAQAIAEQWGGYVASEVKKMQPRKRKRAKTRG